MLVGTNLYLKVNETMPEEWVIDEAMMNGFVRVESRSELYDKTDGVRIFWLAALAKGFDTIRLTYCKPSEYISFDDTEGDKLSALIKVNS